MIIYVFLIRNNGLNSFILMVGVAEWCCGFTLPGGRHMEQDPLEILSLASSALVKRKTALQGGFSKVLSYQLFEPR